MKISCTARLLCQILLQSTKRQESDVFLHTVEQSALEQEQVRELHISVEEVMKK